MEQDELPPRTAGHTQQHPLKGAHARISLGIGHQQDTVSLPDAASRPSGLGHWIGQVEDDAVVRLYLV